VLVVTVLDQTVFSATALLVPIWAMRYQESHATATLAARRFRHCLREARPKKKTGRVRRRRRHGRVHLLGRRRRCGRPGHTTRANEISAVA